MDYSPERKAKGQSKGKDGQWELATTHIVDDITTDQTHSEENVEHVQNQRNVGTHMPAGEFGYHPDPKHPNRGPTSPVDHQKSTYGHIETNHYIDIDTILGNNSISNSFTRHILKNNIRYMLRSSWQDAQDNHTQLIRRYIDKYKSKISEQQMYFQFPIKSS